MPTFEWEVVFGREFAGLDRSSQAARAMSAGTGKRSATRKAWNCASSRRTN